MEGPHRSQSFVRPCTPSEEGNKMKANFFLMDSTSRIMVVLIGSSSVFELSGRFGCVVLWLMDPKGITFSWEMGEDSSNRV